MAFEQSNLLAAERFPKADGLVKAAPYEPTAIGGKGEGVKGAEMSFAQALLFDVGRVFRVEIVDAYDGVKPGGGERLAVRRESEGPDGWNDGGRAFLDVE